MSSDSLKIREIILNARQPLIIRYCPPNWSCFQNGLDAWCDKYDAATKQPATFERICKQYHATPQWERQREAVQMTATEFLAEHSKAQDYWTGLNYKIAADLPSECRKGVDFSYLGFPQAADECSFWLSSTGANTPCHYDTYGCNIVAQVFGRKSWLLFPPDTPLTNTRIPYEESSVYCMENFYAPNATQIATIEKLHTYAYHCILEPNDVLIVPRHWWHYVEALETSLSVNYWVPLEIDVEAQLLECIVKFLIENYISNANAEIHNYVLNPNQLQQIAKDDELFTILKYLHENLEKQQAETAKATQPQKFPYQYLQKQQLATLLRDMPDISPVKCMSESALRGQLLENAKRLRADATSNETAKPLSAIKEALLNSICSPNVVKSIAQEFQKRYKI